jgi:hypothetical protein
MSDLIVLAHAGPLALAAQSLPSAALVAWLASLSWKKAEAEAGGIARAGVWGLAFFLAGLAAGLASGIGGGSSPTGLDGFSPLAGPLFLLCLRAFWRPSRRALGTWQFVLAACLSAPCADALAAIATMSPGALAVPGGGGWNDGLFLGLGVACGGWIKLDQIENSEGKK